MAAAPSQRYYHPPPSTHHSPLTHSPLTTTHHSPLPKGITKPNADAESRYLTDKNPIKGSTRPSIGMALSRELHDFFVSHRAASNEHDLVGRMPYSDAIESYGLPPPPPRLIERPAAPERGTVLDCPYHDFAATKTLIARTLPIASASGVLLVRVALEELEAVRNLQLLPPRLESAITIEQFVSTHQRVLHAAARPLH